MHKLIVLSFLFLIPQSFASTTLAPYMANLCEDLGTEKGVECVDLQRKLEQEHAYMDANGAAICDLIWKWGSRGDRPTMVADLMFSCFKQVSNTRISLETKETCDRSVYIAQESFATIDEITSKVNKMMACVKKLGRPIARNTSAVNRRPEHAVQ